MKRYAPLFFILLLVTINSGSASAQSFILSAAGNTTPGYTGDDSASNYCLLHWPEAVAIDDSNNIFIADAGNNVIRKIDSKTGLISTVAGNGFGYGTGLGGFGGDGGAATAAMLFYPSGVAVDHSGNMYICDQRNDRIRKVDTTGTITTIAGNGTAGYSGDGGAALGAMMFHPTRVALDAGGNIYVADSGNNRIRKIDPSGNISTIAGNGAKGALGDGGPALSAQLFNPMDMAVDASGSVFIADYVNNRIRKVDPGGVITTYAGIGIPGHSGDGGPATAANIYQPAGIIVDAAGNIYFSDLANFRVRKIDAAGIITTLAGNGLGGYNGDGIPATSAKLQFPEGLALDTRGQLYFADKGNNRVRRVSSVLDVNIPGSNNASVSIYPNPSAGDFTFHMHSAVSEDAHVVITSITGQKVGEFIVATNTPVFIINKDISPGIYFLSASTSGAAVNEKIVIR